MQKKIKILAVPGSLRNNSSNYKIIEAITKMALNDAALQVYDGLGKLPHFDDGEYELVQEWRSQIRQADAVLICMPEYAFGVPGSLKNALDWTVSSGELYEKPVALITASSVGDKAHAAMLITLGALNARMNEQTKLLIPFIRSKFNADGELDDDTFQKVRGVVTSLVRLASQKQDDNI